MPRLTIEYLPESEDAGEHLLVTLKYKFPTGEEVEARSQIYSDEHLSYIGWAKFLHELAPRMFAKACECRGRKNDGYTNRWLFADGSAFVLAEDLFYRTCIRCWAGLIGQYAVYCGPRIAGQNPWISRFRDQQRVVDGDAVPWTFDTEMDPPRYDDSERVCSRCRDIVPAAETAIVIGSLGLPEELCQTCREYDDQTPAEEKT